MMSVTHDADQNIMTWTTTGFVLLLLGASGLHIRKLDRVGALVHASHTAPVESDDVATVGGETELSVENTDAVRYTDGTVSGDFAGLELGLEPIYYEGETPRHSNEVRSRTTHPYSPNLVALEVASRRSSSVDRHPVEPFSFTSAAPAGVPLQHARTPAGVGGTLPYVPKPPPAEE